MPAPIRDTAAGLDLTPRVFCLFTTTGSPANQTEAIVCRLTVTGDVPIVAGVILIGYLPIIVAFNGTALRMRIRRTGLQGAVLADTGAIAELERTQVERYAVCVDSAPVLPGQVYVLTSETPGATAVSGVGDVALVAIAV